MKDYISIRINKNTIKWAFAILCSLIGLYLIWLALSGIYHEIQESDNTDYCDKKIVEGYQRGIEHGEYYVRMEKDDEYDNANCSSVIYFGRDYNITKNCYETHYINWQINPNILIGYNSHQFYGGKQ